MVERTVPADGTPRLIRRPHPIAAPTPTPTPTAGTAPVPYRGLAAHRVEDSWAFAGRERLVARLVALVSTATPGIAGVVVGPSGCGKSSALQAGLAARLGQDYWRVRTITPGVSPLVALDEVLAELHGLGLPAGSRTALIVDQFEELFTLAQVEAERQEFVRRLAALAKLPPARAVPGRGDVTAGATVSVVIGLEAGCYDAALRYPELSAALQDRQVVVGPMSADDLRRAVTEPARRAGAGLEPALVELLVHDLSAVSFGALPQLSFALLRTWQRAPGGRRLSVEGYVATGGVAGAVAAAGEAAYEGLSRIQQEMARNLFLRLTVVGADDRPARQPATAADLGLGAPDGDSTAEVLRRFVAAGLVTATGARVEVAHEAVFTAWPRLRDWLDEARIARVTHRRLAGAATGWHHGGRDTATLYRGTALIGAREWAADPMHERSLTDRERAFLQASVAAQARRTGLRRAGGVRRRTLLAGALVLALLVLAWVAWY